MGHERISSLDDWLSYAQSVIEERKRVEKAKVDESAKYVNVPYRSPTEQEYEARWKMEHPDKAQQLEQLKKELEDYVAAVAAGTEANK